MDWMTPWFCLVIPQARSDNDSSTQRTTFTIMTWIPPFAFAHYGMTLMDWMTPWFCLVIPKAQSRNPVSQRTTFTIMTRIPPFPLD